MKQTGNRDQTNQPPRQRLKLSRETLRVLDADDLKVVAGGRSWGCMCALPR